jgi:hypothetical protein
MGGIQDFCYSLLVEFWCCHLWTRPLPLAFDLLICGSVLKKWPLETQVAQIMNLLSLHFAGLAAGLRMSQGGATVQKRRDRSEALGDCRGTKETGMLRREFVTSGSAIFPSGYLAVFAAGTVLLR